MVSRRLGVAACVGVWVTTIAAPAPAQTTGKALAEALFQDGRTLLAAGKPREACAKFSMSQRIEPKLGTLLNLAVCHEADGKTASAWAEFTEAAAQAARSNQSEREEFAREHAKALEPRLSQIAIVTNDADATVAIDGVAIDRVVSGTKFPVDPGSHKLEVSAPRKKPWGSTLTVPVGPAFIAVNLPPLQPEPTAPVAPPVADVRHAPARPEADRTAAWVAFGIGGVAAAAGTYFGLVAFSRKSSAENECDGKYCSQAGLDLYDEATRSATISSVAFGTALVAIGVGTYLLVRPPRRAHAAFLRAGPRAVRLGAAW